MVDIPKIVHGRIYEPRQIVLERLADLTRRAGGVEELKRILDRCDAIPGKALRIAFMRSRIENMLASVGESLMALAVLMGLYWLLRGPGVDVELPSLALKLFLPTVVALALHIGIQEYWSRRWYESVLLPALERRLKDRAVEAALAFYRDLSRKMTVPGTLLYPITATSTLVLIDAPAAAWGVILPAAIVAGWIVNQWLYATRLFHADICEWFVAFSLEITADDERAIREARRGAGLYRYIWDWLEKRGYSSLSPFEAYTLAQCTFGLVSGILILLALVRLDCEWQRLFVALPVGPGLFAVAYSYFLRFMFLNRRRPLSRRMRVPPAADASDLESFTESGVDARSRLLRRAMP